MSKRHYRTAAGRVEYGDADVLFPVAELGATVLQHRDAQVALGNADGSNVVVVAPTSLATSYALTQHALTAIRVESLPTDTRARLADALDAPIESFDLIQIGTWHEDGPKHSLAEFTSA